MEDEALIQRVKNGEARAVEQFVIRTQRTVTAACAVTLGTRYRADVPDMVQETFLKALAAIATFRADSKITTWLFSIAKNVCIDHLRQQHPKEPIDSLDMTPNPSSYRGSPESAAVDTVRMDALLDAVDQLSIEEREVFLLADRFGFSYAEIATMSGIRIGTVRSRLFRARERVGEAVTKDRRLS